VTRVQSRSIRGGSETNITFSPTTEMTFALQQVQARVNQARSDLPANLDIEIERLTPSVFPILSDNLEGGDPATLYDIARYQIKPLISRVPGVGRVDVQEVTCVRSRSLPTPARLAMQQMTFADLATAIQSATTVTAVGRMPQDYKQYLIVTTNEAHSVGRRGEHRRGSRTAGQRHRLGQWPVRRTTSASWPATGAPPRSSTSRDRSAAIRWQLPTASHKSPRTCEKPCHRDSSSSRCTIRHRSSVMPSNPSATRCSWARRWRSSSCCCFLRHARVTAISASSIPITMAITVFVMSLVGQTFNLMTLGAMAIAIGIVIDDAVVITENIVRHAHRQKDRQIAIRDAVQELIWPVTSSTITTVVVFLPLGLLTGVEGQFFHALSITLTIAVLVSLVVALTIIPLLSERYLTSEQVDEDATKPSRGPLARLGRGIDSLADRYERALGASLRHARWIIPVAALLVIAGVIVQRLVPSGFLPEIDEGAFVLDYFSPGGTALAETDRQVHLIEQILMSTPEITGTSRRLGAELGLFATEQIAAISSFGSSRKESATVPRPR